MSVETCASLCGIFSFAIGRLGGYRGVVTNRAQNIKAATADVLRAAYKEQRLTQPMLVKATGINATTMQRIMDGKSSVDMTTLFLLADAIGIPADEILERAIKRADRMPGQQMSEGSSSNDLEVKRRQREAASMSMEQLEGDAGIGRAAVVDEELDSDEPDHT
jgi:transcriptional regulator with XRE-family HTH domain